VTEWPTGFDLHLFSQVRHDWDTERMRGLLRSSFTALAPGGRLVDHDTHVDADERGPRVVAEYSLLGTRRRAKAGRWPS
jgi:hypothetical protein